MKERQPKHSKVLIDIELSLTDDEITLIDSLKWSPCTLKPNYMLMPVTQVEYEEFNVLARMCKRLCYQKVIRSRSSGVSYSNKIYLNAYDIRQMNSGFELTINLLGWCRVQFRPTLNKDNKTLSGKKSFLKLQKEFLKDGIDITNYAKDNGEKIKKTIPNPIIRVEDETLIDKTLTNIHHLDINSSYPAGIAEMYPELYNTINRLYLQRKLKPELKLILDSSIGFMQSKFCNYKYSLLSKEAILSNNKKIHRMLKLLKESGRKPVLINTDGIYYQGDKLDIEESGLLGGWKHDHTNITLRIRSRGAYEYIEDNIYHPVIRGKTNLDKVKDREHWEWGDIYQPEALNVIMYKLDITKGEVIKNETKLD